MSAECSAPLAACGKPATRRISLARDCGCPDPRVFPEVDACDEHFEGRSEVASTCAICGEKTHVTGTVTVR